MKKTFLLLVFAAIASFGFAQAGQEKSSHYKAAEDLMLAMNMQQNVDASIPLVVDQQVQSNPGLAGKRDAFLAFMQKHLSWAAMEKEYMKLYMDEFNEAELKELVAFYRTEIGKKLAERQNSLTLKSSQLGQDKVQANMAELMQLMQ